MHSPKVSPPRPSKSGVAFAEQSTKNSIFFPVLSKSSSALTPTKTSVFASLKCAEPLAWVTSSVSNFKGQLISKGNFGSPQIHQKANDSDLASKIKNKGSLSTMEGLENS